jgi:hypothetical protein
VESEVLLRKVQDQGGPGRLKKKESGSERRWMEGSSIEEEGE